ncbi:helicase-like transcription factor isoform X2 [Arvicanthis niloticus]|uniref:helicase-like transcription factor isoform X2 n=1 Tax=Arvicanthis niloticus TaxID=61156 RepID=UPI001486B199|nr:helicase-like transcription factor isoform X2 [Arvicanthis niloticus]
MSWMFNRDPFWKYMPSAYYGARENVPRFSHPSFFPHFEFQDFFPSDTYLSSNDELNLVLFGTMTEEIVGLHYYLGVVNNNEMVAFQREPHNPYDKNTIKVNNMSGYQIGILKKELAAALAYLMDHRLIQIEGVVPFGASNTFTVPLHMTFWGNEKNRKMVLDQLNKHGFDLGPTPKTSELSLENACDSGGAGPSSPVPVAVQMTTEQVKMEFEKLFEDLNEDAKTTEMEPAEAIKTPLLSHQKQALCWMIARENSRELPPFWEKRNGLYYNTITNFVMKERPESIHGGILADDTGLGKTLTAIAVILTNFDEDRPLLGQRSKKNHPGKENKDNTIQLKGSNTDKKADGRSEPSTSSEEPSVSDIPEKSNYAMSELSDDHLKRQAAEQHIESSDSEEDTSELAQQMRGAYMIAGPKRTGKRIISTLIVCPLSVLGKWIDQFGQHIKSEVDLSIYVYYGPDRSKDSAWLSKQDIILTTYNILTHDYGVSLQTKDEYSPLHNIKWLRVILDEGHAIRNPNSHQTRAVLELVAERRWILTGAPIQNSLRDLWSLMAFLQIPPFIYREWWSRIIQRPVTRGDEEGLRYLQTLIQNITLRRTMTSKVKGKPVLEFPGKKVFIQHITLSEEERKVYQSVKNEGKATVERYFNDGTVFAHYADVVGLLLRLRQICCHTLLLTNDISSSDPSRNDTPEEVRKMLIEKMKLILSSGSDEECAVCLDSLTLPVITRCAHVFCKPCICQVIECEQPHAKCPLCRSKINGDNLLECSPEELASTIDKKSSMEWSSSSKINALINALNELRKENPNIKSLVVSQFSLFLSLIETALEASGFVFTRLDGSMLHSRRGEIADCFQTTEAGSPTVMLLSLKSGGLGLNLCTASRVFLMDPAWNPAAEDQCFERCHQLGQTQEIIITKFIVKDSVEENMLKIQNTKRELAAGAFGSKKINSTEMKQAKINEIKTLIDL